MLRALEQLATEVRQLRSEAASNADKLAFNTGKTAQLLTRFDGNTGLKSFFNRIGMYFIEPFPFKRNMLLNQSSDLGSGDALYSSATIYGLNARVSDSIFGFSYQSLKNNNLGNPLTDALSWTRVAAANVLRAFDVKFALRATAPGSIYYKLNPRVDGFNYDSLSLHDLVAITVTVKYYNTFNALLKTWTINLENPSPDTGYPFNGGNTTDVFITDIPRGTNGYLEIWIDNSLNTIFDAGVGGILFGKQTVHRKSLLRQQAVSLQLLNYQR